MMCHIGSQNINPNIMTISDWLEFDCRWLEPLMYACMLRFPLIKVTPLTVSYSSLQHL